LISEEMGVLLEKSTIQDLGKAKKVTVTKDNTILLGGYGNKAGIEERIEELRYSIDNSDSDYDKCVPVMSKACNCRITPVGPGPHPPPPLPSSL
jgi:chaperonin GroEL (HSP60 family)